MELHLDCAGRKRRPLDCTHARLAISWSWAPWECCPRSGDCRGLLQRHLAWLRWRAHSNGPIAVRRLHQPGAHVAPHAPSLAASLRHCSERSPHLGKCSRHTAACRDDEPCTRGFAHGRLRDDRPRPANSGDRNMPSCGGLQRRGPGQEQAIGQLNFGATSNALCAALRTRKNSVSSLPW